ncbi:MAG: hypothetical protein G8237_04325 [Magnetococcales bacterium]|nr:hypothetical protein [Magnetococcales bacterium]
MKKKIWCAVSGHGFGHWGQLVPVLTVLLQQWPDLVVHVTGNIPSDLIARTLRHPCTHDPINRDVGLIQPDPLVTDLKATAAALRRLHDRWEEKIHHEMQLMQEWQPDLMLGDIPYLPMEAANRLGIPSAALTSLTWDEIIQAYFPLSDPECQAWLATMRTAYGQATLALRITPALPHHPFSRSIDIPPVVTKGTKTPQKIRTALAIPMHDQRPLILVTLGGIPTQALPIAALIRHKAYHWLVDGDLDSTECDHLHPLRCLSQWAFADVIASVDGVVSKPGYGTALAATTQGIPFLYVRRGIFPDELPIGHWCMQHGRATEITQEAFFTGQFLDPLQRMLTCPAPSLPAANGAEVAARILSERFL